MTKPLHILHMDLFGPTSVSSISHKWYCLVVIDGFSRFTWTFFLKSKDETSGILKKFITKIENLKDLKVKIIRCDNGGEFRNKEMNDFCSQKGIKREFSNARTPQQNGVTKKRNRTLIEVARKMLADAKLPVTFWDEAVNTACYVQNWVLVNKSHNKTPYELLLWNPIPTASSPVPTAYSTDSQEPSNNLGVTTNSDESNGVEADISNMETAIIASPTPTNRIHKDHPKSQIIGPLDTLIQTRNKSKEVEEQSFIAIIHQKTDPALLQFCLFSCFLSQVEPKKISDALQDPSWVLKNKKDERGIVIRNKARLVAQGYTQEKGIGYDEVFAPVVRIKAIRLFLAHASFMGFTVYQIDVKSALLYGTIDEEVYVMQPPGFQDPEFPTKVYKVEKAMYGLHQAPRAWYGTLSKYLLKNGFQKGTIDQTIFIRRQRGDFILVQVYVDDIIFGSFDPQLCREFEALMHEKLQMSAMGDILKKFRYTDVRSSNTPMDKENPWGKDGTGKDVDLHLYRSMIRSLMYLTVSRPDIMFAACACARHQVTPKECHMHAVKRIFR
nr:hypothetical protein [Tanacetum cinerariifolium]